ncbi:hypothetical protein V2J09_015515 [Rumex salicifolius]
MKHIALAYHFVHQHVQQGIFHVSHVATGDQRADILIKPLLWTRFDELIVELGFTLRPSSLSSNGNFFKSKP